MRSFALPRIALATVREYYRLTKPGIIYGNNIAVVGGFLLASRWHIDVVLLLFTVLGISLIMASGCVFNNYIDRDIDAMMERTKRRALVEGRIDGTSALIFGASLYALGAIVLATFTNLITLGLGAFGLVVYVFFYSVWSKRHSVHSTLVGAFAGAVPPVVGYTAVADKIDTAAVLLFLILTIWQLPHAFAIAIRRLEDYRAASIPVLPVAFGVYTTKVTLVVTVAAFSIATFLLFVYGYTGTLYLVAMSLVCVAWLALSILGFKTTNDTAWGRQMFFFSLIVLLIFCTMIAIDPR